MRWGSSGFFVKKPAFFCGFYQNKRSLPYPAPADAIQKTL
jgi:hypothetical protein